MKIKDVILAIAIIVLTIFVTFYGVNTVFPKANYDDYCGRDLGTKLAEDQVQCEAMNGTWYPQQIQCVKEPCPQGYCDFYTKCSTEYDQLNKSRSKYVFFLALPLGIIIILLGAFKFGMESVGAGLMGGGVGTLIYGAGAFWPYTQNWIRFLLSLLGLAILIWFVYFWSKKSEKKGKRKS